MNTAMDIARFLIQYYNRIKKPITNVKLQKLLYYAWIEYYISHGKYLFKDSIHAWKLGPVVPEVYYEYRIFAAMPISSVKEPSNRIDDNVRDFLEHFAEKYKDTKAFDLVSRSHEAGKPWEKAYGYCAGSIIPFKSIVDLECQNL